MKKEATRQNAPKFVAKHFSENNVYSEFFSTKNIIDSKILKADLTTL